MEKTTSELTEILKRSKSVNDFFEQQAGELEFESIGSYLEFLLNIKGITKQRAIQMANLDASYAYQIFNGNRKNPGRNKIIMLCFGMSLSLEETKKLMRLAKVSELYIRDSRDAVIMYSLEHHLTLIDTNEELFSKGMEILE